MSVLRRFAIITMSSVALCSLSSPGKAAAADSSGLTDGERLYMQASYQAAVGALKREIGAAPKNATLHYYLANTYLALGLLELATLEYQNSLRLDPHGPVGSNSSAAIRSLQARLAADPTVSARTASPPPASAAPAVSIPFGFGASAASNSGTSPVAASVPPTTGPLPSFMIEAQLQIERVNSEANAKIATLNTEMQDALRQAYYHKGTSAYLSSDPFGVQTDYQNRIAEIQRQARQETDQIQDYANQRLRAWQETMSR
ncbi:MAG TPA: hypothetical protein V6C97_17870 [Oculatellaceae cyanobacterium]